MIVNEQVVVNTLLIAFDLGGTFVFALSGATAGVKHRLDLFGVLVLSFAAGNSGGIARDLMIGAVPPAAISDWRYIAVSMLAGLITFYWYRIINRLSSPVLVFDAAGLALFAVSGAGKALAFHAGPVAATLLGMLTGIGGGMARDVLVTEIPTVLRTELYAVAALIGAAAVVIGRMLQLPTAVAATVGAMLCFGLRFAALRRGWQLPRARVPNQADQENKADTERTTSSGRH
ncbi:MAG TPA: trimeric intracellular cation channel family protein [Candidatus Acidoferrales bacterium]|nr:trimeric intracellular cation channel family protein [Candidatus Acidoferrales bacterium]